jgi:hypothetical protein
MCKYLFVSVFIVIFLVEIKAQNNDNLQYKKRSFKIQTGYYRTGLLDKTMSPILFIGNGTNLTILYKSQTNKSLNQYKLQFSYLPLYPADKSIINEFEYTKLNKTENYEAYPLTSINGIISYEHLRCLILYNSKMDLLIGGVFYNYIQVMYPYSWILSYTLGPKGILQYSFNENHSINTTVQFPVISITERPPYATYNNDVMYESILKRFYSGKIMWPNELFYALFSMEYQINISEKISCSALYTFTYTKCKRNREYSSITNVLNMGITYKFR